MLLRFVCAGALVWAAAGCRTTDEDTANDVKSMPPGAQGLPVPAAGDMKLLVSLEDEPAQAMYDALNAEEQTDQIGGRKSYQGDVSIFCERSGSGGQLPPGAQGIVAPASYHCSIYPSGGANFPDGAQGMPPAPALTLDGQAARSFYAAFKVQESTNGPSGRKNFQGNAEVGCQYSESNGARTAYLCTVRGEAKGGDTQPEENATLLSLTGGDAKLLWDKLSIPATANVKQRFGDTILRCEQRGFGGQIPPGAQGMVAAATFECNFLAPASLPNGAQGMPGQPRKLAKLKGALAKSVFDALQIQTADIDGGLLKEYQGEATIRCGWAKVSGKKVYDCLVKQGLIAGMPPGAQGLPLPQGG